MAGIQAIQKGERIVQLIVEGKVYDVGMTDEQYRLLLEVLASEAQRKIDEKIRQNNELERENQELQRQKNELGPNLDGKGGRVGQENERQAKINDFIENVKKLNVSAIISNAGILTANYTTLTYNPSTGKFGTASSSSSYDVGRALGEYIGNNTSDIYTAVVAPYEKLWDKDNETSCDWVKIYNYGTDGYTFLPKSWGEKTMSNENTHVYIRKYCDQVTIECTGAISIPNNTGEGKEINYTKRPAEDKAGYNATRDGELFLFQINDDELKPLRAVQTMATVGTNGTYGFIRIERDGTVKLLHSVKKSDGTVNYVNGHALICFNISYKSAKSSF